MTATFKFPKTLGACADRVYALRQERLAAQQVVEKLEVEEKALKEHIINTLPKSEATGAAGRVARVTVVTKQIPQVKDWPAFYAYVKRHNAWDLLQRRITDTAVKERWGAGKEIPGVDHFTAVSLSINKV